MLDVSTLPAAALLLTNTQGFTPTQQTPLKAVEQQIPEIKNSDTNLKIKFLKTSRTGQHVLLEQTYHGIPIVGGVAVVHSSQNGNVYGISSQLTTQKLKLDTHPKISATKAAEILQKFESSKSNVQTELTILPIASGPKLAWKVNAPSLSGPSWEVFVDAKTGETLSAKIDRNRYEGVKHTGQIFRVNPAVSMKQNIFKDDDGKPEAIPNEAYFIEEILGLSDGIEVLDGKYASSKASAKQQKFTDGQFLFRRGERGFTEMMAYYYIDYAQRFIQSLGFENINNRQISFAVDRLTADNSFYSPDTKQISFGSGGVDDAEDAEVILHELGHAIQDNQVKDFGDTKEGRAMGEGFGDFFAASTLSPLSDGFQDDCVAEWDATAYSDTTPPCLRRMDSQKIYPKDMQGEEHADGEIWSAMLWDIYQAFGREKSVKLVLESHFYLTSRAKFVDGAKALVLAGEKLKLSADENVALNNIIERRGFKLNK